MQTGIIGLPQVGKTTLFRILTKANVEGKSGQATHVGVAKVPEARLVELAKLYNPKKITYATIQYVDLGGMQKERMRESLASLRDVDAIAHVIRVFDDPSVPHSEGTIDPLAMPPISISSLSSPITSKSPSDWNASTRI